MEGKTTDFLLTAANSAAMFDSPRADSPAALPSAGGSLPASAPADASATVVPPRGTAAFDAAALLTEQRLLHTAQIAEMRERIDNQSKQLGDTFAVVTSLRQELADMQGAMLEQQETYAYEVNELETRARTESARADGIETALQLAMKSRPPSSSSHSTGTAGAVRLTSAEASACLWSGTKGGYEWEASRQALAGAIEPHCTLTARVLAGTYTREMAVANGGEVALEEYMRIDNNLANIVFRSIRHDVDTGTALRAQIVQMRATGELASASGVELIKWLNRRDEFTTPGERREGANQLKSMKMNTSAPRATTKRPRRTTTRTMRHRPSSR